MIVHIIKFYLEFIRFKSESSQDQVRINSLNSQSLDENSYNIFSEVDEDEELYV